MGSPSIQDSPNSPTSSWSNRVLILATAGILFLTMYPFRLNIHPLANGASPFLLGKSGKSGFVDAFLNVLLFVPFGFGLAEKLRERGKSIRFALLATLAAGVVFSYVIEFSQLYVPERDSGWEDVFTNGTGSLIGGVIYALAGVSLVRFMNWTQRAITTWLTPFRLTCAIAGYFCVWFGFGALLQSRTQFSNWKPYGVLVLGNSGAGSNPRQGQLQTLQIWNHPLSDEAIAAATTKGPSSVNEPPIIDYDSSRSLGMEWIPAKPATGGSPLAAGSGSSPLPLQTDATALIEALRQTNHFTAHVVCTGVEVPNDLWTIFLVGDGASTLDLMVWQENGHLVSWLRTPLSAGRPQLTWFIPRVFTDHKPHDILYSYDGANLQLYLDGKKTTTEYIVGPGAGLARLIHRLRPGELGGYNYAFYALVFVLGGALLSLFGPHGDRRINVKVLVWEVPVIVAGALGLEWILVKVTGRAVSQETLTLSVLLAFAGLMWGWADRRAPWREKI
jgi:glycopeptide antibiotics resistance protein